MFDSVPDKYVLLNRVLTLGQDDYWRHKLLQNIKPNDGDKILDACTGTGDLALKLATEFPKTKVHAMDFSPNMLSEAEKRADAIKLMLEDYGIEDGRFRLEWISASEGPRFAQVMTEFTEEVKNLGPSPYKT